MGGHWAQHKEVTIRQPLRRCSPSRTSADRGEVSDFVDAAAFLAGFETMIDKERRRCNEGLIYGQGH